MSKIGMISLGCPKNQVDAEILLSLLNQAGHELVEDIAYSDAAIVNTCGFIESAKQESIEEILELAKLKAEGRIKAIIVTGCLAERYREELAAELPEIDVVVGLGGNSRIVEAVEIALGGQRAEIYGEKSEFSLEGKRVQTTPQYYSYLRIADGCDNRCTYCAIPLIRGGFRSRSMENVLEEAQILANRGVKELNIIAQDVTRYGDDLYGELKLPELLQNICKIEGIEWIRLLYCYPDRVTDELLEVMASEPKIVKYMDLPLQHVNGEILTAMNRSGDFAGLSALIAKIRAKVPQIVLRTTFIVGFPNESEEHFEELLTFIAESKFERLGCFVYSPEEGTPAAEFANQVPRELAERRQELVMDVQSLNVDGFNQSLTDKALEVLVEDYDRIAEMWYGRTKYDAPEVDCKVFFTAKVRPKRGSIINVKIVDYMDCDLIGESL
ncbi:MAG: 30S ribosomal protein S12 methylthiotransferase RimO [Oscillospiraceae bacterium]|jgi:ribosomal protein S12 methylthiotransferase|nr:30S ribosomal protein S12 methylthiotransferase RimO [Oscillospiraceae bacterium]